MTYSRMELLQTKPMKTFGYILSMIIVLASGYMLYINEYGSFLIGTTISIILIYTVTTYKLVLTDESITLYELTKREVKYSNIKVVWFRNGAMSVKNKRLFVNISPGIQNKKEAMAFVMHKLKNRDDITFKGDKKLHKEIRELSLEIFG